MRYAVNVADLTVLAQAQHPVLEWMLRPILTRETQMCETKRVDSIAALVSSDVPIEQWDAMFQIIRDGLGQWQGLRKHELRIYQSKTGNGGWKRI